MRIAIILLGCVLAVAIAAAAAAGWFWTELHTSLAPPAGGAVVSIAPGEVFRNVCVRLEEAGVVRRAWVLHRWAGWTGEDRLVRSGDYRFTEPASPLEVLETLRSPGTALNRVTIPEGRTLREVVDVLERGGLGGADEFLCVAHDPKLLGSLNLPASGLEGYLFPDTYDFAWTTSPEEILRAMVQQFRKHTESLQQARLASGLTEIEMITLASMIESETGVGEERAVIAGVFRNRLRIGMRLQSDPTAVYERGGSQVSARDLQIDSPYNTYLHPGLPPGPICNPGLASMRAAVAPADVPYLYFVARKDGTHVFSRTLEEHNLAVADIRRSAR
jgi:UPF0755 protein